MEPSTRRRMPRGARRDKQAGGKGGDEAVAAEEFHHLRVKMMLEAILKWV